MSNDTNKVNYESNSGQSYYSQSIETVHIRVMLDDGVPQRRGTHTGEITANIGNWDDINVKFCVYKRHIEGSHIKYPT